MPQARRAGTIWVILSAAWGLAHFTAPHALAAPPNRLTPEESAAGWTLLFDGTTTDSWRAWNGERFPAAGWIVRENALQCQKSNGRPNGGGGDIVTRKEYSNFDLRWEWKIAPDGNSGVIYFLRRRERPDPNTGLLVYGHEYQLLDDDAKEFAKVPPPRKAGALYGVIAAAGKDLRPAGQFNSSRILVQGDRIEHWLNEKKVVEYELGSQSFASRMSKSKYAQLPGYGTKIRTPILLQDHGHAVSFRNLKILDLGDLKRTER
jgi:hypothetical protein